MKTRHDFHQRRHVHASHHPHEHGHGPHLRGGGPGPGRGGRRRGRAQRGDVRAAILLLLAETPMHGYQLMQTMAERSGQAWRPSPGAVYPTINQLEDEGLVTVLAEGGRRLVTLTPAGQAHVEEHSAQWGDPFAEFTAANAGAPDLRTLVGQIAGAARQLAHSGSTDQLTAAATVLADTRRALYLLLADGPAEPPPVG